MKSKKNSDSVENADGFDEVVARLQKVNQSLARALVARDVEIERLRKRVAELQGVLVAWPERK